MSRSTRPRYDPGQCLLRTLQVLDSESDCAMQNWFAIIYSGAIHCECYRFSRVRPQCRRIGMCCQDFDWYQFRLMGGVNLTLKLRPNDGRQSKTFMQPMPTDIVKSWVSFRFQVILIKSDAENLSQRDCTINSACGGWHAMRHYRIGSLIFLRLQCCSDEPMFIIDTRCHHIKCTFAQVGTCHFRVSPVVHFRSAHLPRFR